MTPGATHWPESNDSEGINLNKIRKAVAGSALRVLAAATLCAMTFAPASAQTPGKVITLVVPFAPGGPGEFVGRLMIPVMQERLKAPIVLETRQGAGGSIGISSVVKAEPDGHTLLWTSNAITTDQAIKLKPAFDPLKDLRPVTMGMGGALAINVNPQVPAKTLRELIAYAKANPGKLNYSHAGVGSFSHLASELFKLQAGIDIVAVPYRGGGQQALASTIANDTQITLLPPALTSAHAQGGRIRILAVASEKRVPTVPDVPTTAEAGLPGVNAVFWYGLFVPAGTPNDIFNRVETAAVEALTSPDVRAKIEAQGYITGGSTSAEFRRLIEIEVKQWREVVAKAGIPRE